MCGNSFIIPHDVHFTGFCGIPRYNASANLPMLNRHPQTYPRRKSAKNYTKFAQLCGMWMQRYVELCILIATNRRLRHWHKFDTQVWWIQIWPYSLICNSALWIRRSRPARCKLLKGLIENLFFTTINRNNKH